MSLTRLPLAFVIALCAAPALGATPASFDLLCAGQGASGEAAGKPVTVRLSVDMAHRHWCYRDAGCANVFPLSPAPGGKLILLAVKTPLNEARFDVDLGSGAYSRMNSVPARTSVANVDEGRCEKGAYTPIP